MFRFFRRRKQIEWTPKYQYGDEIEFKLHESFEENIIGTVIGYAMNGVYIVVNEERRMKGTDYWIEENLIIDKIK